MSTLLKKRGNLAKHHRLSRTRRTGQKYVSVLFQERQYLGCISQQESAPSPQDREMLTSVSFVY